MKIGLSRKTKGCQTAQKFVAKDESQKTRYVRQRERDRESGDKAQKKGFSLLAKKYVAKFVGHGGRRGRVLVGGMWVGWKAL